MNRVSKGVSGGVVIVEGVFNDENDAFDMAVKAARVNQDCTGVWKIISEKKYCRLVEVPKGIDPMEFAKECAEKEGNHFWTYEDGPAGCVVISDKCLKESVSDKAKIVPGFKRYVFFG